MSADGLRIGDAEREQAQTTLNDHYAAGRLDHDEYVQRLDQIWAARTREELSPVFADLPSASASGPTGPAAYSTAAARRPPTSARGRGPRLPVPLLVGLVVLGTIAVVTHLPFILVGLGVWFFFLRGGPGCGSARRMHRPRGMHHARW